MQPSCRNKILSGLLLSVLLAALCSKVNAYPQYKAKLPNGDKVPNPCNLTAIWTGVGHQSSFGSGARNSFGLDFQKNNHVWDRTLCEKDSDEDGMTNGQELGDPNCTWTEGSTPTRSTNLSHPGVCEPLGSHLCSGKNSWLLNCSPGKLNCQAINAVGVRNTTLRFPVTPVPTKETTYICHRFDLPSDSVSDIIAIEPVIDNAHILHHMLMYGCTREPYGHPIGESFECGMSSGTACWSLIGIWGVGGVGQCLNSQLGFRIGPGGFQYAVIQLHWNNPEHSNSSTDSSGMRIYHTTQLRTNQGQVAIMGQMYLEIPPGKAEVAFTGTCFSACTRRLPQSIFITSATLHMHTLGKSGEIRLSRNGKLLQMLDEVHEYDYNAPRLVEFETPIEVKPGDEIQVKCVYQSTQKNSTTYFGEATSDEMCFGFFAYYPLIEDFDFCGQWKSIGICSDYPDVYFEACDFGNVRSLLSMLYAGCTKNCTSTICALVMDEILATGCQNYPDVTAYIYEFMPYFGKIFQRCVMERPPKPPSTTQPPCSHSSGQFISLYLGLVVSLMAYVLYE